MIISGVAVGMAVEGWNFLTAMYVIVQIITTIGFGDVTVTTWSMQLFMSVYVILLLIIVADFLNIMIGVILEQRLANFQAQLQRMQQVQGQSSWEARRQRQFGDLIAGSTMFVVSIAAGMLFYGLVERCTCSYGVTREDSEKDTCRDESHDSCIETGGFQHTWVSAFYMSVITITTVGFGDFTPKSALGRAFALFWMPVGVAATGSFIRAVSGTLYQSPHDQLEGLEGIDEKIFQEIDRNGDGHLTKAEYTRYILLKHGFLPREVLHEIDETYDAMDVSRTGKVTFAMIQSISGESAADGAC